MARVNFIITLEIIGEVDFGHGWSTANIRFFAFTWWTEHKSWRGVWWRIRIFEPNGKQIEPSHQRGGDFEEINKMISLFTYLWR
jgi:hypothetical protein